MREIQVCLYNCPSHSQKGGFVGRDCTSDDKAFNTVALVHYVPEYTVTTAILLTRISRQLGGDKFYRANQKIRIVELAFFLRYILVFCFFFGMKKNLHSQKRA